MRVVIFAGGTGSVALQSGLYRILESSLDGIETKIIVNAYDNGLSTGAVRQVMGGRILGPSDVRKNQATRLALRHPDSPWLDFLGIRFTADADKAPRLCDRAIDRLIQELPDHPGRIRCGDVLRSAVAEYFQSPAALEIEYNDFSLANIIYAGLARAHDNSLRAAARVMSELMDMPDNVLLNDDRSLFLGAITQSGHRVCDEGAIVAWGNEEDPFVDVFFIDADGNADQPELCLEAWQAIIRADLIVISSGTQWSSLIPTYASRGFKEAIRQSSARVVMVMNRNPDKDSPGQSASEIIHILVPRYFDPGRLHVLADANGDPRMRRLQKSAVERLASFSEAELSTPAEKPDRHHPGKLAAAIGRIAFKEYLDSDVYLFDYDDTLVGRGGAYPNSSRFNVHAISKLNELTNVCVCTGNTVKAVTLQGDSFTTNGNGHAHKPLMVFADGGVNQYSFTTLATRREIPSPELLKCSSPNVLLSPEGPYSVAKITAALCRSGIPLSKVENRGNVIIAIRPVAGDERDAVLAVAKYVINGSDLEVREIGRTTVEICKPALSKIWALKSLNGDSSAPPRITYIGDEIESGNDQCVSRLATENPQVKCLEVESPAKTAFFISTLIGHIVANARH